MTPHDAAVPSIPAQTHRSLPDPARLTPTLLPRPARPVRRLVPATAPVLPAVRVDVPGSGPITACGSCLLVATGGTGVILAVDPSRPQGPHRVVGRHGARVTSLAACDGLLFSAGCDGLVVTRASSGRGDLATVVGVHSAGVTRVLPGPGGRLVTAGHDGRVLAWQDGGCDVVTTHPGGVEALAVLATGVVTAGRDGRLLYHSSAPAEPALELRQRRREITMAVTTASGGVVTASGQRGVVRFWEDLGDGAWSEELGAHLGWVLALVALDADRVAAVGGDRVTVWDLRTGDHVRLGLPERLHACGAAALPGGELAVTDAEGRVEVLPPARLGG